MASDIAELYRQAAELPDKDRAKLAALLLESLDAGRESGTEAAWDSEIELRIAQLDSGEVTAVAWETVKTKLERRLHDR